MQDTEPSIDLTVLAPAHNEQDNIGPLVDEIDRAISALDLSYEIIVVDDASTDGTADALHKLAECSPQLSPTLRVITFAPRPNRRGYGQSAAFYTGIRAARGRLIAMLDADLQNDPADIPELLRVMSETNADLVQGDRSHARQDTLVRRVTSVVGRITRRAILGDMVRDTGCSLRLINRETAHRIPLEYRGMHRFIPITALQLGCKVVEHPVSHRPRIAGVAKYGIWNRAIPGLIDCFAVRWMRSRRVLVTGQETAAPTSLDPDASQPEYAEKTA